MQGYLEKKGGVRRNWLRRWFAIEGEALSYYSKEGGELKGSIPITANVEPRLSTVRRRCALASQARTAPPPPFLPF